ncbi:NAD(P)-dependent oxidoreductase [Patescibacteria group bacterium]|nr:NAD(P)-dependent oxidoreductase [Patescibacteria group bacterium]MBU2159104.1 NAD(P)-dependent oxidoreductase [Patescibacteria group bacterium]MBU2220855.1 NAD(P)-dependent oxidoreductase [Patescibacteria group bacterium]
MARYFVTGGSGFLGINLVRHLLEKGVEVVSFDLLPFEYPERERISEVVGDIREYETLKEAMKGCDVVVHTAAALPLYTPEDIRSTDILGTENVLKAAKENDIARVVHISSTAVYGIPDHHPLTEEDELDGVGEYGKAKIAAEKVCETYRQNDLIISILRPKSFIGPERLGVFALFYDWAADGHGFPMIGSGRNRYQLLDVEDLCEAIWLASVLPAEKVNDTFNIGAKEFLTMKEDYQAVLDVAGYGKKIHGFPATPMIWTLRVLEFFKLSPLYKWVYETASKDSFVSIEKAETVLGWKPQYSNMQALIRNYEWYLAHRDEFAHASGVTHRVPWKQGVLSIAKRFF